MSKDDDMQDVNFIRKPTKTSGPDTAKARADRKVRWITKVEEFLLREITPNRSWARSMVDNAMGSYGDDPLGRDWLERWFFIEVSPRQAAWNVAHLSWGWRPTESFETPQDADHARRMGLSLEDYWAQVMLSEQR